MKKQLLFLFGLLTIQILNSQTNCEDPILANFECVNTLTLPGTVSRITNSFSGGINTTPNIGQYSDNGTEAFDALVIDYGATIDLSTNNRLKLKLYSPDRSIQILAKLEGGTPQEIWSPFSNIGEWQEFTFDFSASIGNGNSRIVLFFNGAATTGNTTDLYYFDDLEWISQDYAIWLGTTSSDWDTAANWDTGTVPTTSVDVLIPNAVTKPVATGGINVRNITIQRGSALTVNGAVTNTGKINIESGASFIAKTSVSGEIAYKRYLSTNNWYLVSPAVVGETIQDLISTTTFETGTVNASNLGLAPYDNNTPGWSYQNSSSTGSFDSGKGVSVKTLNTGVISFSGNMATTDVAVTITDGTANKFNLVGNPYPSYLPANTNADATNSLLEINSSELSETTLWFWDESLNDYITVNNISPARYIAPGQGFFVSAKTSGGTLNFTEAMQSHQTTDVFNKTSNSKSEITLQIVSNSKISNTEFYFIDSATNGFDNGYDSSLFSGIANPFAIYSQLVEDNDGKNLAIQTLPSSSIENSTIPLGLNAESGEVITFSIKNVTIPSSVSVYLEDRETNEFILLDNSTNHVVTLDKKHSGIGRFYLRTSSQALSTQENTLTGVNVFTVNNRLKILGFNNETISVEMFNILGTQVLSKKMNASKDSEMNIEKISTGVYIVKVNSERGSLTKKVIVE